MISTSLLLLLHFSATSIMLGIVWFVQLIRYPSFAMIPSDQFVDYHRKYTTRIGYIVGPAMLVELLTGVLMVVNLSETSQACFLFSMVILVLIWISTFAVQVPCHHVLGRGFQVITHRRLVATNWYRTIGWTLRWILIVSAIVIEKAA